MTLLADLGVVENYAELRRAASTPTPALPAVCAMGKTNRADSGAAMFLWDPDSVAADNDDTVVKPSDRTGAGRWVRFTAQTTIPKDPLQLAAQYGVTLRKYYRSDLGITLNTQPTFTSPNDFTNAAWTKGATTAPSANVVAETAATAVHTIAQVPTGIANDVVTIGFTFGHGPGSVDRAWRYIEGNGGSMRCFFNITAGTIGTQTGGVASITDLGGGKFRCTVQYHRTSGSALWGFSTDGATISYAGDVNADSTVENATVVQVNRVIALADQGGAGNNSDEAAVFGPLIGDPQDGINGLLFNDLTFPVTNTVSRRLQNTSAPMPVPATTPTWRSVMVKLKTWTSGRSLWSSVTGFIQELFCSTGTPQVRQFVTANGPLNAGMTVGQATRVEECYLGHAGNSLKCGTITLSGASGNAGGGGGFRMAGDSGANVTHETIYEWIETDGEPPQAFKQGVDNWFTYRYPTSNVKQAGLPAGAADTFFFGGTSNAGNTNGQADPTGIADETDVRVLSPYNATSLITTLTPQPNVGVHVRLCNQIKALGRRPAILRHFSNGSIITNWQKGFTLGDQLYSGISNLKGWLVGDYNPAKAAIVFIGWENDATIEANSLAVEGILRGLANNLTADFPGVLQIHCGISPDITACPFRDNVNTGIQTVVNEEPVNRIYVPLTTVVGPTMVSTSDHLHYLEDGQAAIADLIWSAYLSKRG